MAETARPMAPASPSTGRPVILVDATALRTPSGHRGIGRHVRDLLEGLHQVRDTWRGSLDIQVVTAFGPAGPRLSGDLAAAAAEAHAARGESDRITSLRRSLWAARAVRQARARVLHLPDPRGVPPRLERALLLTCYDFIPLEFPAAYLPRVPGAARWARQVERWRYARARAVVCISERTRHELRARLDIAPRAVTVPLGIDLSHFRAEPTPEDAARRTRLGVGAHPYLFYAGHSDYRKNVRGMLETLAHARREQPLELVWAGRLGERNRRAIVAEAAGLGVAEALRLVDWVSDADLTALYRGAVAHLLLSRAEGFGLTVVEAMASGCPVIVARGGGADEVAGMAGATVDPDRPGDAARLAARLQADGAFRERMIAAGRQRAEEFDRRRMAERYVALYAELARD